KVKEAGALAEGLQQVLVVRNQDQIEKLLERYLQDKDAPGKKPFTRTQVEAAMDAFDRYRNYGEESETFRHFGDPRDYWVRSSRERENRVFPSKPLVGYLLKKTELNGGWGQKADAAARLHNSGFIIVDQADEPVQAPER